MDPLRQTPRCWPGYATQSPALPHDEPARPPARKQTRVVSMRLRDQIFRAAWLLWHFPSRQMPRVYMPGGVAQSWAFLQLEPGLPARFVDTTCRRGNHLRVARVTAPAVPLDCPLIRVRDLRSLARGLEGLARRGFLRTDAFGRTGRLFPRGAPPRRSRTPWPRRAPRGRERPRRRRRPWELHSS